MNTRTPAASGKTLWNLWFENSIEESVNKFFDVGKHEVNSQKWEEWFHKSDSPFGPLTTDLKNSVAILRTESRSVSIVAVESCDSNRSRRDSSGPVETR